MQLQESTSVSAARTSESLWCFSGTGSLRISRKVTLWAGVAVSPNTYDRTDVGRSRGIMEQSGKSLTHMQPLGQDKSPFETV